MRDSPPLGAQRGSTAWRKDRAPEGSAKEAECQAAYAKVQLAKHEREAAKRRAAEALAKSKEEENRKRKGN